jgi:hypothetical protein
MRFLKFIAVATATASLFLIAPAPSHAQRGKSTQNVRSTATPALSTNKPHVRPVAVDTRDHRKIGTGVSGRDVKSARAPKKAAVSTVAPSITERFCKGSVCR